VVQVCSLSIAYQVVSAQRHHVQQGGVLDVVQVALVVLRDELLRRLHAYWNLDSLFTVFLLEKNKEEGGGGSNSITTGLTSGVGFSSRQQHRQQAAAEAVGAAAEATELHE
jgi:hypothetical protein